MGFLNDVWILFGREPSYKGGVQEGKYFYCIDDSGDVYRQLSPLAGPLPKLRPWVRVDENEIPPKTKHALDLLSL